MSQDDRPPLPSPTNSDLLTEDELEELFVCLAEGEYESALTLPHHQAHQLTMFSLGRQAQLWLQIEQRIRI